MKLKMEHIVAVTPQQIIDFESQIGVVPPKAYLDFVCQFNGAKPESNVFDTGNGSKCGISKFIAINKIADEKNRIENLPADAFPIAWAEGGNYVLITSSGKVLFWDHETAALRTIGDNFDSFIAQVEPFDINSIQLKPGQVKRSWIDPDFLKSLKNK